ncbi:lipase (class 2) domain-containing protein [Ditylenchus destructor]|uniref:Lipase (Class 2) domain-containing protein n=1 Tax=Ditylenchus destructor TaxID=166010 RepID=A0AAD4QSU9_9BILA|nr:lipase (class 2) domain-containing protein [Ditylenchus destructor]
MLRSNSHLLASFGALMSIVQISFSRGNDIIEPGQISKEHIAGPLTDHFLQWLKKNGYADDDFAYAHMGTQASFGGKFLDNDKLNHYPVIFIHGNSDGAMNANYAAANPSDEGWSASISEFLQNGYTSAELYAVTYGDRELKNSLHRTMDCETVIRLRRFVTAVLAYTNSSYVDIVSHSMGVSFARRLIKGGHLIEPSEESATKVNSVEGEVARFNECYIGEPIHHKIHTFIGIAGANYGMCFCSSEETEKAIPACGKRNGFWPGSCNAIDDHLSECLSPNIDAALKCGADHQYSSFLKNLNKDSIKEAKFIVSMWSDGDEIIGKTNLAWGRKTSLIPQSDKHVGLKDSLFGSMKKKDEAKITPKNYYLIIRLIGRLIQRDKRSVDFEYPH